MKKDLTYLSFLWMFFLASCSSPEKVNYRNWEEVLMGYGKIGLSPESMTKTFYYFGNRVMDSTKYTEIKDSSSFCFKGDRVTIPNLRLVQMIPQEWWEKVKSDNNFNKDFLEVEDSTSFMIEEQSNQLLLRKLTGVAQIPSELYVKMNTKALPEDFMYLDYEEYNKSYVHVQYGGMSESKVMIATDRFDLKADSLIIQTKPILNHQDSLVVNSFLNLLIERRYQEKLNVSVCYYPMELNITMVYKDSLFYFNGNTLPIDAHGLVEYFNYQLNLSKDKRMSTLEEYPPLDSTFPRKSYSVARALPGVPLIEIAP
ncbi:hypothetical protein [Lishizhenia sp.]|uniref:hypothetical protein n=1 Tax=Lishizhenia sp. TaxID=2497594 RepID=UPI00299D2A84|nr:hypothetical protein [Lishizhenia sp.]MDX1446752.1 hypothetical protein [Lishizhenia sp.]